MRPGLCGITFLFLAISATNVVGQTGSTEPSAGSEKKLPSEIPTSAYETPSGQRDHPPIAGSHSESRESKASLLPASISLPGHNRFKAFLNDSFGPDTLIFEGTGAAITTGRNAPKEWGGKTEGFALRFASNLGKNLIKQSVTYGLDEALKIDSTFYRSRDRGIAARFRNSVFSAVTARDRRGKRVVSIPKIAGSLVGNVTAAQLWYPDRYNYVHGLKGTAITLAFDAAHNLLREFVWKK